MEWQMTGGEKPKGVNEPKAELHDEIDDTSEKHEPEAEGEMVEVPIKEMKGSELPEEKKL
jgi:hypothetical protein